MNCETVLLLDCDLALLFLMGEALAKEGYWVIPSHSCEEADLLLETLEIEPTLVIANPAIPDSRTLIHRLSRRNPAMLAIALLEGRTAVEAGEQFAACLRKRADLNPMELRAWVATVRRIIGGNRSQALQPAQ